MRASGFARFARDPRANLLVAALVIEVVALCLWPAVYLLSSTDDGPSKLGLMFTNRYPVIGGLVMAIKSVVDWVLPGALWTGDQLLMFTFNVLLVGFAAYALVAWRLVALAKEVRNQEAASPAGVRLRWILIPLVVFQVTLIVVPGTLTTDIYNYAIYGEMPVLYGANPYVHTPGDFPQSPLYYLIPLYWHDAASVYGPVWVSLSAGVAMLTRNSALADEILMYRLIANLAHFANALLVWAIACRLHRERAGSATVAYAWNPLLLLEFALNGHNDVLMLTLALAAVLIGTYGRLKTAAVVLGLSVATKYTSLLLAGPLFFAVARSSGGGLPTVMRRVFIGGLTMLAVVGAGYALWYEGPDTFGPAWYWMSGPRLNSFWPEPYVARLAGWVAGVLGTSYDEGWNVTLDMFKLIAKLSLVALVVVESFRVRSIEDALAATAQIALVFLLIVNTWLMPWYYTWPLAFCAALGWERLIVRVSAGFTVTALFVMYQRQFSYSIVPEIGGLFLVLPLLFALAPTVYRWLRVALGGEQSEPVETLPNRDVAPAR